MYRIVFALLFLLGVVTFSNSSPIEYSKNIKNHKYVRHEFKEAEYQHAWCSLHNGIEEYQNRDFTRVDCLTETHAVEFDFANKWAESIGQALHYSEMTGKRGMVVLILDGENPQEQIVYFKRVQKLAKKYDFDAEYVTKSILKQKENCKNK